MEQVLEQFFNLSFAIFSLNYEAVEKYLADESFEVNFYLPRFKKLPRDQAIESMDSRIINLFLNCPRVDWMKPNELNFEELDSYGIEYDKIIRKSSTK